jgi:uncharacterized membrane protein YhaH (DUF805 family)
VNWYLEVLRKYAVTTGRARRKEYWIFLLCNTLAFVVLIFLDVSLGSVSADGNGVLSMLYSLAVTVPSITVGIRRMHDTDHSGWWIIVPFVNLVFAVTPGTPGSNRFGPEPAEELLVA